jgi:hypothetical protein
MRGFFFCLTLWLLSTKICSQTLGGNASFSFLQLPVSAQQSALGGLNISTFNKDVANAWANPALLRSEMNKQLSTSYNAFLAGINQLGLVTGISTKGEKIMVGAGIQFLDYGTIIQTDAAGNNLGFFKAADYALQLMASTNYKEHFRVGMALKFLQSHYGQYRASGVGADFGITYYDSTKGFQVTMLVKNIGTQLTTYEPNGIKEELPFDLQAGISYAFTNIPLQVSITAQQLHRFTSKGNEQTSVGGTAATENNSFFSNLGSHFLLSAQYRIANTLECYAGYNFLRGRDLNISNGPNALNGFSTGFGLLLKKFTVHYGTGFYQKNMYHHFSVNFNL